MRTLPILAAITLLAVSCTSPSDISFDFGKRPVSVKQHVEEIDLSTFRYDLRIRDSVQDAGSNAIRLDLSGAFESADVEVGRGGVLHRCAFLRPVEQGSEGSYFIPVSAGTELDTLRLTVHSPGKDFSVDGIGSDSRIYGVSFGSVPKIDSEVVAAVVRGNLHTEYNIDFSLCVAGDPPGTGVSSDGVSIGGVSSTTATGAGASGVALRYHYPSAEHHADSGEAVEIEFRNGEEEQRFQLSPQPGGGVLFIYRASIGFFPEKVRVVSHDPGFQLTEVSLLWPSFSKWKPIPADFTTILDYSMEAWRQEDFELFRWNRYPSILVFDTRSYATQAAMFRRMAFFVEKPGYTGRVLADEELEGKHGWNAHDYRPVDLAEFFTAAAGSLNAEEITLREVLLREGVIIYTDDGYVAGDGGIISISQESSPSLRRLFLAHEGHHGVFFADSGYKRAVFSVWTSLDDRERHFWRLMLAGMFYNTKDEYLVVNEFQAYLLQQSVDDANSYFVNRAIPRLKAAQPEQADFIDKLLGDMPGMFHDEALDIVNTSLQTAGVQVGSLFSLEQIHLTGEQSR